MNRMGRGTSDFRKEFEKFSDDSLIDSLELAALLATDRTCLYVSLKKGQLVKPVIHRNRQIRWRAGDVREWLRSLAPATARKVKVRKQMGRPRGADAVAISENEV